MSKNALVTGLVLAVVALAVVLGWAWNERRHNDITIDVPGVHIK